SASRAARGRILIDLQPNFAPRPGRGQRTGNRVEYRVDQDVASLGDSPVAVLSREGANELPPPHLGFDHALLRAIAERVGTPVYVYSANLIRAQYHALSDALLGVKHRICYSVKANGNLGV